MKKWRYLERYKCRSFVRALALNSDRCCKFPKPFSCCPPWLQSSRSCPFAPCSHTSPSRGRISFVGVAKQSWPSFCTLLLIFWAIIISLCSRIGISFRLTRNVALGLCFRSRVNVVQPFLILSDGFPLKVWVVICFICLPWAHVVQCSIGWSSLTVFVTFEAKVVAMVFSSWSQVEGWLRDWRVRLDRWYCMTFGWRCPFGLITSRIQKGRRTV